MRRIDREVKGFVEILGIIERCQVCRIAFNTDSAPYILPMNFGFSYENDNIILCFHTANEGKKLELIQKNPIVGFSMDCSHSLVTGEEACSYSMKYESIIGSGRAIVTNDFLEKEKALKLIMNHCSPEKEFSFPEKAVNSVTIFKIEVIDITAKRHK